MRVSASSTSSLFRRYAMMPRLVLFALYLVLVIFTFLATAKDEAPGTVKSVVKGVWFREGDNKQFGHCNNAIIEMKDYLIVVDANFPSGARMVMEEVKKLSPKPVKYVFDTHHHGDHAYGNALWTQAGAITLAYQGVVDEMNRYEPARWRATAKTRPDVAELNQPDLERPKQTFKKSPFILKDDTREVQFIHFGWAHTRGDAMVWLPKERVLCTGDAVVNGAYNNTADANITNWPKVIDSAAKLKPLYILPGHGASGGPDILTGQKQYLVDLRAAVAAAVKQGKKLDEIDVTLPAADQNWIPKSIKKNVTDAYNEITLGKPAGELPHP
jgi:cyclase